MKNIIKALDHFPYINQLAIKVLVVEKQKQK